MEKTFEKELDQLISQGIESDDVSAKDQWLMILLATVPFILATIWYYSSI
jgi:hypothetical protein